MGNPNHQASCRWAVMVAVVLLSAFVGAVLPVYAQGLDDAVQAATGDPGAATGSVPAGTAVASVSPALGGASGAAGGGASGSSLFALLEAWVSRLPSWLQRLVRSLLPASEPGDEPAATVASSPADGSGAPGTAKRPGDAAGVGSASGSSAGGIGSVEAGSGASGGAGSEAIPGIAGGGGSLGLPARPADAPTGSEFMARLRAMPAAQRERAILDEIARGNVPDFMRRFREVRVTARGRDGREHTGTVRVLPDYLCVGTDADFIRLPMMPQTAQAIADRAGCILPTRQIVNVVAAQAQVRLNPQPIGSERGALATTERHQRMIETQRAGQPLGALTVGAKKDVVISNLIPQRPNHVVIYGWHSPNGSHIQPLSNIHAASYVDYSHGIRLVSGTMTVDGREMPVADVLRDPDLCRLVSDEGALRATRYGR